MRSLSKTNLSVKIIFISNRYDVTPHISDQIKRFTVTSNPPSCDFLSYADKRHSPLFFAFCSEVEPDTPTLPNLTAGGGDGRERTGTSEHWRVSGTQLGEGTSLDGFREGISLQILQTDSDRQIRTKRWIILYSCRFWPRWLPESHLAWNLLCTVRHLFWTVSEIQLDNLA